MTAPSEEVRSEGRIRHQAESLVAQLEHELAHPYVCEWCRWWGLPERRFKTERGYAMHLRRAGVYGCNPARWDLFEWVPFFDANLHIRGGCQNTAGANASLQGVAALLGFTVDALNDAYALAAKVQRYAIAGGLPRTKAQLGRLP